jgi:hypothetical protein
MQMLQRAIRFKVEEIVVNCVDVIGRNFCYIGDADFSFMPPELFVKVLKHPRLAIRREFDLYQEICKYIRSYADGVPEHQVREMMEIVRWRWMALDELRDAIANQLVPRDLLVEAMFVALEAKEGIDRHDWHTNARLAKRRREGVFFKYNPKDNDLGLVESKGIINWIATAGGRSAWDNPHITKKIIVTPSSIEKGDPKHLVARTPSELWTKDVPASWLMIDLGPHTRALPNYYTLRHGGNYRGDSIRTWDFQGSVDGKTWTVLRRHTNDSSLNQPFGVHSWVIDLPIDVLAATAEQAYRFFRILQRGHNSSNHNFLVASGIELYGMLFEVTV